MKTKNDTLKKNFLAALEKTMGIVSTAAKKTKISRSVHYDWIKEDENYRLQVQSIGDIALDFAESKLMQSINNGSDTATIFFLKTKGKDRGYVERSQMAITNVIGEDLPKSMITLTDGTQITF
jgi:hypothetical protein